MKCRKTVLVDDPTDPVNCNPCTSTPLPQVYEASVKHCIDTNGLHMTCKVDVPTDPVNCNPLGKGEV